MVATVALAGVSFRPTTLERLIADITRWRPGDGMMPPIVGFVNPHVVMTAVDHPVVAEHLGRCTHVCVDGIGVSAALRLRGIRAERLPAHRALDQLLDGGALTGRAVVIGIEQHRIGRASDELVARCGRLDVVATSDGFATDDELVTLLDGVGDVDVILIGAGSPRSEAIAELASSTCPHAIVFHVGAGTLKVLAGDRRHPPRFLSRLGLDWAHRLLAEPHTRPRYLRGIPAYLRLVSRHSAKAVLS